MRFVKRVFGEPATGYIEHAQMIRWLELRMNMEIWKLFEVIGNVLLSELTSVMLSAHILGCTN